MMSQRSEARNMIFHWKSCTKRVSHSHDRKWLLQGVITLQLWLSVCLLVVFACFNTCCAYLLGWYVAFLLACFLAFLLCLLAYCTCLFYACLPAYSVYLMYLLTTKGQEICLFWFIKPFFRMHFLEHTQRGAQRQQCCLPILPVGNDWWHDILYQIPAYPSRHIKTMLI